MVTYSCILVLKRRERERERESVGRDGVSESMCERERECYKIPILSSFNKITNVYTLILLEADYYQTKASNTFNH